jgi:tetratricopeptide (TPR) repeat protein
MTTMRSIAAAALALAFVLGAVSTAGAGADPRIEALRREAYDAAYNMDYERSMDLFGQAIAADPSDTASLRGAASVIWLRILFLRGTVLAEDYLGRVRGSDDVKLPDPPDDLDRAFQGRIEKAIALGEKAVDQHYNEAAAHYDLSAGLGLAASYAGTVRGSLWSAMKLARRSYSESEMVLKLDKRRKEAGLVIGTYRYLVSSLPVSIRWMAYLVGFGGGKEEGIRLIEEAAGHPSDIQQDARFALVLLYNREKRYTDAVNVLHGLQRSFPRNRLLQLEEASTFLRAGRPADALKVLNESMARLAQDARPRMPGEDVRWYLKRGTAHVQLGMLTEAEEDLKAAAGGKGVWHWVLARIHIELGKVADLRGDRARAKSEYEIAVARAMSAGDDEARAEATRLLNQPYKR